MLHELHYLGFLEVCGIAGAFGNVAGVDRTATANRIIARIRYRGPDGDGVELFDNGFFVHLRLAIIDTSSGGAQPKWTANRRYCITYNGEIYNFVELKEELTALGRVFDSGSDTEVLLQAWDAWGPDCLKRFIGMFAFAIYDAERRELHLARDAYGIKPLYIADVGGGLRFGSTYAALHCFDDCPRTADAAQAFVFVRYGLFEMENATLVDGVRSLTAGTVETWDVSGDAARHVGTEAFLSQHYCVLENPPSFDQAAEELREAFMQSVRLHLRSDVPTGFALSGGIDSSAIVCAARLLEPDADLRTFTYSEPGWNLDERRWAELVTDKTKALPHIVKVESAAAVNSLRDIVRTHGVPTAGMSTQAQFAVFKAAHDNGVTVMLDGQGADELFAGYPHYVGAAMAGCLARHEFADAAKMLASARRIPGASSWGALAWCSEHTLPRRWRHALRRLAGLEHLPDWIDEAWVNSHSAVPVCQMGPATANFGKDRLGERLAHDVRITLPTLLQYEDRNSMHHSVESRVPFLAAPVSSVALGVPSSYHIDETAVSKRLLRAALRGIVPEEIRTRSDKIGFAVPQGDWLANEHKQIDQVLRSETARRIKLLDWDKMIARWERIDSPAHPDFKYVWRWLGLILWTDEYGIVWPRA